MSDASEGKAGMVASEAKQQEGGAGGGGEDAKQEQDDALPPGVLGLAVDDADREAVVALDAKLEAAQTPYRDQATYEMKVRFIRARKYDVKKAHKMIADHLMWRDLNKPATISRRTSCPPSPRGAGGSWAPPTTSRRFCGSRPGYGTRTSTRPKST